MANTLMAVGNLVRGLATLALVLLLGTGGYLGYQAYHRHYQLEDDLREREAQLKQRDEQIGQLQEQVAAQEKRIQELDLANRLLKVDHRLAEIRVVDQSRAEDGRLRTTFEFVEVNDAGDRIDEPRRFTIDGDVVYIDAWVVKYHDDLVESGNPLGSTSVCLFRRLFGETQKPADGFPLDRVGAQPIVYRQGQQITAEEQKIWDEFWEYANNPALAEKAGVRAAHGEAPSTQLRPGKLYKVELRASGGLSIVAEDAPATGATAL